MCMYTVYPALHRGVFLVHIRCIGLRLNLKKSVIYSSQRTTFLGAAWDSTTMQACRSLPLCNISGHANLEAGILSRQGMRSGEIHFQVVEFIWQRYSQEEVVLFASEESIHFPLWFALTPQAPWRPVPKETWLRLSLYTFPPIALLLGVLVRVRQDRLQLLLMAPFWSA